MSQNVTSVGRLDACQVRSALDAAVLAPSTHNTQPWLFRCTPAGIELLADPDRALPVADPDRRELLLSCGAALFNLRTAIHALGTNATTTLLPRRTEPGVLAVVRPISARRPDPRLVRLALAIPHRHTNRAPFSAAAVPPSAEADLRRAAESEQAWLPRLGSPQIHDLRELVRESHQAQIADPAFLAERSHWTGRDRGSRDGVPAGPATADDVEWMLRDSGSADGVDEPLVVVIGSFGDQRADRLRAGQAMQRVLLTATAAGLAASFLPQPVEVAPMRAELRRLVGGGLWPQIVLRFGVATPAPKTARRPLADVMLGPLRIPA